MATFIKPSDVPEATSRSEFKHLLGYDANDEWIKGSMNVITPMANGGVAGIVKDGEHVTFVNGVPVVTKASDTILGLAKSGEDIKFNNGVPSIAKAGNGTPGLTQDGEHITYDASGKPVVKLAGENQLGLAKSGDKITFTDGVPNIVNASVDDTGVVKVGNNIDVAEDGTISVKKASKTDFGVAKIGDNLNIDENGVLSVPLASGETPGVVKSSSDITFTDGMGTINRDLTMNVLRLITDQILPQSTMGFEDQDIIVNLDTPLPYEKVVNLSAIELTDGEGIKVLLWPVNKRTSLIDGSQSIHATFFGWVLIETPRTNEYSGGDSIVIRANNVGATQGGNDLTSINFYTGLANIQDDIQSMSLWPTSNAINDLIDGTITEGSLSFNYGGSLTRNTRVIRAARSINDPCYYFYKCGDESSVATSYRYICHTYRNGKWHILNAYPDPDNANNLIVTYSGAIGSADVPVATATTLGIVKPGTGLTVTEDGTLNASAAEIPMASKTVLGGIKIGNRVTIKNDGTLDVPRANSGHVGGDYAMGVINPSQPHDDAGISSITDDDGRINNIVAISGKARTRVIPLNSGSNLDTLMQLYTGLDVVFELDGNYIGGPKASSLSGDGTLYNYKGIMKCEGSHFVFFDENTQEIYHAYQAFGTSAKNMWWTKLPTSPYSLPVASAKTLGGVKVGSGLAIDNNGLLSAKKPIKYEVITQGELSIIDLMNSITGDVTYVFYIGKNPQLGCLPPVEGQMNALMILDGPGVPHNSPFFRGELVITRYTAKLSGFLYKSENVVDGFFDAPVSMFLLSKDNNGDVSWFGIIANSVTFINVTPLTHN